MLVVRLLSVMPLVCIFLSSTAFASSCESHSAATRTQLIELYTSEGCSSCPPADKWLSALIPKVVTAEEVVPLAYHVDYWDRLGWRDRFADPAFTARQYAGAKISGSGFVFTPQVVLAGRNFGAWGNSSSLQRGVSAARTTMPDASITLRQQAVAAGKVAFEVQAQLRQGFNANEVRIYAALFQNGLVSEVGKGENSGSRLHHDYVVRSLLNSKAIDSTGKIIFQERFILPEDAQPKAMGVAVFAQDAKTGTVLQVMAAPLCLAVK